MTESYSQLARDLYYRAVLKVGEPLSDQEYVLIERDPRLLCTLWVLRDESVLVRLGDRTRSAVSDALQEIGETSTFARAVLKMGTIISREELTDIEEDEGLLIPLVLARDRVFYELMGQKYRLLPSVVGFLLEEDLRIYKGLLNGEGQPTRVETYTQRAIKRLQVHLKNYRALVSLAQDHDTRRHAFFDVGALFGLTMVSAAELGYEIAHGCELDTKVFKRARRIREIAETSTGIDFRYFEEDFADLDLDANLYTLIVVNNVLEHTPRLEDTIANLSRIMADDGVCYVYQGNYRSPHFTRVEPHYRLPLLTLLPKELTILILQRLGRCKAPEEYVVTRWPGYDELRELFVKHEFDATFHPASLGYWGNSEIAEPERIPHMRRAIVADAERLIFPHLNGGERFEVDKCIDRYFSELDVAIDEGTLDFDELPPKGGRFLSD